MALTYAQAITRVQDYLKTPHTGTTEPSAYSADFLMELVYNGVCWVADKLPPQVAGDLVTTVDLSIPTGGTVSLPSNFNRCVRLTKSTNGQIATFIDAVELAASKSRRNCGSMSAVNLALYATIYDNKIEVAPAPTSTTIFQLLYRKVPTAPTSDTDSLGLPQQRFEDWACLYAVVHALISSNNLQTAGTYANMLNSLSKSAGIRALYLEFTFANTAREDDLAGKVT